MIKVIVWWKLKEWKGLMACGYVFGIHGVHPDFLWHMEQSRAGGIFVCSFLCLYRFGYLGNIVIIVIFSERMFGHIGHWQCELSGLESIKQLRLHSPNFAHIIVITVTIYLPTLSPAPPWPPPPPSVVGNIMKQSHWTQYDDPPGKFSTLPSWSSGRDRPSLIVSVCPTAY